MSIAMSHTLEDLLIAVLHKVGRESRLVDNFELAKIFNEFATKEEGSGFARLKWHPQYHFSKLLSDTLQILDHAGSIIRENPAQQYFRVSPHTAGPYGEEKFGSLDSKDQRLAEQIAQTIKEKFETPHGSKKEN